MIINIHAKAACKYERTGVEEYAYQLIKHLAMVDEARNHSFFLYTPRVDKSDLRLPRNFVVKKISVVRQGVNSQIAYHHKYPPIDEKYILFVGRLEKKKNVRNIVKAFDALKEKYKIPHKQVLVGKPGFGYQEIEDEINSSLNKQDIIRTGYISHEEKESFFKYADVFVFPPFYQGFGMPVLEAQLRQV